MSVEIRTLTKGACKLIGNGTDTRFWTEPWIPNNTEFKPIPKDSITIHINLTVKDLAIELERDWNIDLPKKLFD